MRDLENKTLDELISLIPDSFKWSLMYESDPNPERSFFSSASEAYREGSYEIHAYGATAVDCIRNLLKKAWGKK